MAGRHWGYGVAAGLLLAAGAAGVWTAERGRGAAVSPRVIGGAGIPEVTPLPAPSEAAATPGERRFILAPAVTLEGAAPAASAEASPTGEAGGPAHGDGRRGLATLP